MDEKGQIKQTETSVRTRFPKDNLEKALKVAQALEDKNSGNPLPPQDVAIALERSPGSSGFRILLSSSIKYGLTSGSYNSPKVSLTSLGRDIVEPKDNESRKAALVNSAFKPELFSKVFDYYKGKKVPETSFFENTVVRDFGIPKKQAGTFVEIFMANMRYLKLIRKTTTGPWFASETIPTTPLKKSEVDESKEQKDEEQLSATEDGLSPEAVSQPEQKVAQNVFISHGRNKDIVKQLKELLSYGKFTPIVAEEHSTTSKPVPEKVLDDMRRCFAGIIHIEEEQKMVDSEGKEQTVLNQNVLIEIGAALALYKKNIILLVEKGIQLPSNLQGLYRCEYEGKKLDYDSTMKLLKTFNELAES